MKIRVFVSYSRESADHAQWVEGLARRLHLDGIDTVFDDFEVKAGDDLQQFMEKSVRDRTHLVLVCTQSYCRKANSREGGVGQETTLITGFKSAGKQCIPLLRETDSIPDHVRTLKYVDFSPDSSFERSFEELVRAIRGQAPVDKPEPTTNLPNAASLEPAPWIDSLSRKVRLQQSSHDDAVARLVQWRDQFLQAAEALFALLETSARSLGMRVERGLEHFIIDKVGEPERRCIASPDITIRHAHVTLSLSVAEFQQNLFPAAFSGITVQLVGVPFQNEEIFFQETTGRLVILVRSDDTRRMPALQEITAQDLITIMSSWETLTQGGQTTVSIAPPQKKPATTDF
jgi:hypothetical protein